MKKKVFVLLVSTLAFMGCAGSQRATLNRVLDEKLAHETTIKSRSDLSQEATSIIATAPGLTDFQRVRLRTLKEETAVQTNRLIQQSLKLRSVLVKTMLDPNADPEEVDLLKTRIKKTEQERVSLFFRTVHSVNTILGRWGSRTERENQEFYDHLMLETVDLYYM